MRSGRFPSGQLGSNNHLYHNLKIPIMNRVISMIFSFSLITFSALLAQNATILNDQTPNRIAIEIGHLDELAKLNDTCPTDTCLCSGGYIEIQLYYFGEDNVNIDVFSDNDLNDLVTSFAGVNSGELLTIDGSGLPGGTLEIYTFLRVTYQGGDECTTRLFTRCPTNAWPGAPEDLEILGKTFREFTVFSITDEDNNQECTIASTEQDWHVGGNIVQASNNTLGTRNDESVVLITNDTPRGVITNGGDFGLGTTAPNARLDVDGDAIIDETLDVNGITRVNDPTASTDSNTGALQVAGGAGIGGSINAGNDVNAGNNLSAGNDLDVGNDGHILGNLGVGTASPGARLEVDGNALITETLDVNGVTSITDATGSTDATNGALVVTGGAGVGENLNIGNDLSVNNNGVINGTLGVNTSDIPAGYIVAIDGNVICEEVRVQLSEDWPDYVFERDYPLLPLAQVEKEIAAKGHLPATPSAAEMEANGIKLSQMVTTQQKQIEELFLYIIEMNKKIERLEQENQNLKKQTNDSK